jgi:hypothetical protein
MYWSIRPGNPQLGRFMHFESENSYPPIAKCKLRIADPRFAISKFAICNSQLDSVFLVRIPCP